MDRKRKKAKANALACVTDTRHVHFGYPASPVSPDSHAALEARIDEHSASQANVTEALPDDAQHAQKHLVCRERVERAGRVLVHNNQARVGEERKELWVVDARAQRWRKVDQGEGEEAVVRRLRARVVEERLQLDGWDAYSSAWHER
jgi:hypothetical protein